MPRRKFIDVPMPPKAFRLDRRSVAGAYGLNFESEDGAEAEDAFRAASMRKAKGELSRAQWKCAKALRKRLKGRNIPTTLASSRFMRELRLRVCGQLWRLLEDQKHHDVRFFTIIPRDWERVAGALHRLCPKVAFNGLRRSLNRNGASKASGFLYAALHGEFDPTGNVFRPHIHGFASGSMIQAVERLRKSKNYKSIRTGSRAGDVWSRTRVEKKPTDNVPKSITYTTKSYWLSRVVMHMPDGSIVRPKKGTRIPEPEHTEYLLWLDNFEPHDLILTIGLSANRNGLKIARKRVQ